jgi:hypothetical protein
MSEEKLDLVSSDEKKILTLRAMILNKKTKGEGISESDLLAIFAWANDARVNATLLDSALKGEITVTYTEEDGICFIKSKEE